MNLNKIILTSLCAIITTATAAFAAGENVVASKKYTDDTFQTKISTGNVLFWDDDEDGVYDAEDDVQVPGLVAYDPTTGALNGRKIGILDYETIASDGEGSLNLYSYDGGYGAEMDNFVPTVHAVANDLQRIWNSIEVLPWTYTQTAAVNNYSTAFNNTTNNWSDVDSGYMVNGLSLANGLALKQNKIPAHAANAVDSVLTDSTTDGNVQKRAIFDGSATYAAGTHANQIPTMGAVMSAITNGTPKITWSATQTAAVNNYSTTFNGTTNNWVAADSGKLVDGNVLANAVALKQNKVPAGIAGNVVTYTGTAGMVGSVATYDGSTTYAAATDANKIATAAFVETKQKKKVCAGWPDDVAVADRTDANCWLWTFPD